MAPQQQQAQSIIPADSIFFTSPYDGAQGKAQVVQVQFDGLGHVVSSNVELLPNPKLAIPTAGAAGGPGLPTFPMAEFERLMASDDAEDRNQADALSVEYFKSLRQLQAAGGEATLRDQLISACFDFVAKYIPETVLSTKDWTTGVVIRKEGTVIRIPPRPTPETGVVIVVQPAAVWGG